jgi:hypothetical protein
VLTESSGVLSQPASWTKLLVVCVELCEPEPREGSTTASHSSAADASKPGGAAAPFADEVEEIDTFDGAVLGGGVGGVGGGEEYSAAFSRLAFASHKDRSAYPHVPDAKRWLVEAIARLGARFPGRIPAMIDASPIAATLRKYATTAGVGIP